MNLSRYATIVALISVLAVAACANTVRGVKTDLGNTADAVAE